MMELQFKTSNKRNMDASSPKNDLPCPSIFLPIIESEYNQERARSERIDNKAMALLTVIIALITVYVPIFPFDDVACVYSLSRECFTVPIIFSLLLILGAFAVVLAIYSAYRLVSIYKTQEYKAVDIEHFNTDATMSDIVGTRLQINLIDHYQCLILSNSKINKEKAEALNKQFRNVIIIFVLLSISAVGTLICVGF